MSKEVIAAFPVSCFDNKVASVTIYDDGVRDVGCPNLIGQNCDFLLNSFRQDGLKKCQHLFPFSSDSLGTETFQDQPTRVIGFDGFTGTRQEVLFEYLHKKVGQIISKEELCSLLQVGRESNAIEVQVSRLRKKMKEMPIIAHGSEYRIITYRRKGYVLSPITDSRQTNR
jgi:hypothetical protein